MSDESDSVLEAFYTQLAEFHSQEAISMMAKYQHVEKLIGVNHHNLSAGYHCEILLKEYLRRNLPKKYSVDTGFIRCNPQPVEKKDEEGNPIGYDHIIASPQIDILVHNDYENMPIYKTGDCAIVEPEAVAAVIEVKKTLTTDELRAALQNVDKSYKAAFWDRISTPSRIFKGIFAFSSNISEDTNTFEEVLREHVNNNGVLPNSIAVMENYFVKCEQNHQEETKYVVEKFKNNNPSVNGVLQGFMFCLLNTIQNISSHRLSRFSLVNMHVSNQYIIPDVSHG